jgi:hypothetical protein
MKKKQTPTIFLNLGKPGITKMDSVAYQFTQISDGKFGGT